MKAKNRRITYLAVAGGITLALLGGVTIAANVQSNNIDLLLGRGKQHTNDTWPFQWDGQVVTKGRIWIEFSPKSLIYALILCFLIAFVIIFPFRVKKEKFNMQCCIGLVLSLPLPIVLVFMVYNLLFTVFLFSKCC